MGYTKNVLTGASPENYLFVATGTTMQDPNLKDINNAASEQPLKQLGVIMYIEEKPGLAGHARIGRVSFSHTRRTVYYRGRQLQSLNGNGYKANYFNIENGLEYWITGCKKNGNDTLYPGIIEIDEDAREEYWIDIRKKPENIQLTKFRSEGKYAKRRPA